MIAQKFLFAFALITLLPLISCQLRAFPSAAKLPSPRSYVCSFYDGGDQIYLFGGFQDNSAPPAKDEISVFTISTDSLQVVGQLPVPTYQAKAVADPTNSDDILLFTQFTDVYRFNKVTRNVSMVASLPLYGNWWDGFIQISNTSVLFLTEASSSVNPNSTIVFEFNLVTQVITEHAPLPVPLTYINGFWDRESSIYIFGETYPENRRTVMFKYDLTGKTYTQVMDDFVGMRYQTAVVWDGQNATLVAGYPRGVPENSVTIYNPNTNIAQPNEVIDYPLIYLNFQSTSAVYVQSSRTIYVFGGWAYGFQDGIWFIERAL